MGARGWHILRDGEVLTLCRAHPVRFDVEASSVFPKLHRLRLAHQIRQDMWRALQRLRGFSPVVQVSPAAEGLIVRAGGQTPHPSAAINERIADLLAAPKTRARWIRFAGGAT